MEYHTRFEPDVSPINMARELDRICNSHRGGAVDQAFLYFDAIGAAGWTNLCRACTQSLSQRKIQAKKTMPAKFLDSLS